MSNGMICFLIFSLAIISILMGRTTEATLYLCTGWIIYAMGGRGD